MSRRLGRHRGVGVSQRGEAIDDPPRLGRTSEVRERLAGVLEGVHLRQWTRLGCPEDVGVDLDHVLEATVIEQHRRPVGTRERARPLPMPRICIGVRGVEAIEHLEHLLATTQPHVERAQPAFEIDLMELGIVDLEHVVLEGSQDLFGLLEPVGRDQCTTERDTRPGARSCHDRSASEAFAECGVEGTRRQDRTLDELGAVHGGPCVQAPGRDLDLFGRRDGAAVVDGVCEPHDELATPQLGEFGDDDLAVERVAQGDEGSVGRRRQHADQLLALEPVQGVLRHHLAHLVEAERLAERDHRERLTLRVRQVGETLGEDIGEARGEHHGAVPSPHPVLPGHRTRLDGRLDQLSDEEHVAATRLRERGRGGFGDLTAEATTDQGADLPCRERLQVDAGGHLVLPHRRDRLGSLFTTAHGEQHTCGIRPRKVQQQRRRGVIEPLCVVDDQKCRLAIDRQCRRERAVPRPEVVVLEGRRGCEVGERPVRRTTGRPGRDGADHRDPTRPGFVGQLARQAGLPHPGGADDHRVRRLQRRFEHSVDE